MMVWDELLPLTELAAFTEGFEMDEELVDMLRKASAMLSAPTQVERAASRSIPLSPADSYLDT